MFGFVAFLTNPKNSFGRVNIMTKKFIRIFNADFKPNLEYIPRQVISVAVHSENEFQEKKRSKAFLPSINI